MDRLSLEAQERQVLGKKVKTLRKGGLLPGHVFGKGVTTEHVSVDNKDFLKVSHLAGETGLIDLKIGEEKVRPVLIRDIQYDPISGLPTHIDFYQVNLKQKVKVSVPLILTGVGPESVKLGEAIVLQTLNEVEVEALPADLVEKIEVDISTLKNIDDAMTVGQLSYDREKLTVQAEPEEIVVKLAPAVTAEMEQLLEEQKAEAEAAVVEAAGEAREEEAETPAGSEEAGEGEIKTNQEGEAAEVEGKKEE